MKAILKGLIPPIIVQAIRSMAAACGRKAEQFENPPTWTEIVGGPARGCWLYVRGGSPVFSEMIAGTYDDFFWRVLEDVNLEGTVIVDVGGHIGYHSLCFSRLCGANGKVYAFEPNAVNLERMRGILKRNEPQSENVCVVPAALSNSVGTMQFHYSRNVDDATSAGGFLDGSHMPLSPQTYEDSGFTTDTTPVDTLDHFVDHLQIPNVALIKIDVEGAEHLVLEGGLQVIASHQPILLVEIHSVAAMFHVCRLLHSLRYRADILQVDRASRCFIAAVPQTLQIHPKPSWSDSSAN